MTDNAGEVDVFKSVDESDPPGRKPTAADLRLPKLPDVQWTDRGRREVGRRKPSQRKAVER